MNLAGVQYIFDKYWTPASNPAFPRFPSLRSGQALGTGAWDGREGRREDGREGRREDGREDGREEATPV
ncbi:MAG: hypothetical protein JW929_13285 [Anaerolineales bacterium]|nr:hypothetical protein [Anaerolineales bacterium]